MEFIRQLTSCIQIAGIADADRHTYLHLHHKGGALTYSDQLSEVTRTDYVNNSSPRALLLFLLHFPLIYLLRSLVLLCSIYE